MKKILALLLLLMLNVSTAYAEKEYSIHFNGKKFNLLYSIKNKDFGGYLNEYYKKGDTYNIWTEMVAVHHFPNAYSPIDRIKDFKDYLGSMHVPSSLTFDDKKNTAMIDFIMINDHSVPIVIEFNIFKYEKSKKCGSVAIQYARRYTATTTMQIELIKRDIEKNRTKLINKVKHFGIPELITKDIDKCISAADIIDENEQKTTEEITASKQNTEITTEERNASEQNTENISNEEAKNIITEVNNTDTKLAENTQTIKEEDILTTSSEQNNKSITDESSEEEPSVSPEQEIAVSKNTESNKEEAVQKTEEKQEVSAAPVPEADFTDKSKSTKKNKNNIYEVTNNKDEYIAIPRTKKELKEEIKAKRQKQKDIAKQAKIQAKANKKAAKIDAINNKKQDKINKMEAKKAEKAAKKPYTVTNNNSDLIATPRTKKEIKASNKIKRKESKERVKQAKKKLNS